DEEPYRLSLSIILKKFLNDFYDVESIIHDLMLVLNSLVDYRGTKKEISKIRLLIESLKVGGFVTAEMDIREDSAITTNAAKEIISKIYDESTSIVDAINFIERENNYDLSNLEINDATREVINTFETVKDSRKKYGINSINTWIVAMTGSSDDLTSIAFLALLTKTVESKKELSGFRIVPLLETIDDLKNANKILKTFWTQIYEEGSLVEVMIGYSDSNKDGGIIKSQWNLYSSQKEIFNLSKQLKLDLILFHGRGGSSSRGGGPSGEAILSQPLETINGKIKITQQGEVISDNFANPELSETNLKIIMSSVLEASLDHPEENNKDKKWFDLMNILSDESYSHYKDFISQRNFFDYLTKATPLEEFAQMNIGSRPSKRRGGLKGIEDLRAIPWVFSWTQSRQIIPGWYGFGHTIEKAFNDGLREEILEMYKELKFFKTLVSNIEMNLVKTDMNVSRAYIENLYPEGIELFNQIQNEYTKSVKYLKEINGSNELLESNMTLKKTLSVRESYILPLNIFQLILLKKLREESGSEDYKLMRRSLLLTINGISAGLKNTG
ncbi:MAG: phosphoenolpyruvate carboxylase, partial [Chloroflexota bacterium]|nr:phosphoenolpyruvate carboxylase [Chloroflexota bacterium]